MTAIPTGPSCPCGLGETYDRCCRRFHDSVENAATAELLMRSRYSAFAVGNSDYLLRTWHSSTRPGSVSFDPGQRWSGLEILGTAGGGMLEPTGTVEFRAHYTRHGVAGSQHELSRFAREQGRWVYVGESGR